ncbi:dehydrin HIRD11-like [Cucumis sativus]|uniref:Uncharacterized protein n=1 Tax=Cucumis sativus TaxID=3659 RepID=A0A0A0LCI3_CUCSA|nr:dehydrin HIRD11-like [Cucumis sativus]KGN59478.1 hypothetical protein Csa_001113 [Cucumis sativus]
MAGIMKKIQETVQSHKKQHDGENGAHEGVGIVEKMKEKIHGYKEKNKEKKKQRKERKEKKEKEKKEKKAKQKAEEAEEEEDGGESSDGDSDDSGGGSD